MKHHGNTFISIALVSGMAMLSSENAHAYIDPGTGTLLIQWLFGLIFAGLAVMKVYWAQAKMFITSRLGKRDVSDDIDGEKSEEPS